jgi:hypothetical protein
MPNPIPDGNLPASWWAILVARFGNEPVYCYFKGTYAQAKARARRSLANENDVVNGPYPTKRDAKTWVRANKVNPPFSL